VAGDPGRTVIASADVVVVGSGAFGASVAYHLARLGARVAVLERSGLASQTSPRAAGLSSQVRATPALTRLAQRAVVKLAAFADETGQPLRFTQSGALKIARTERDAEQLSREVARGAAAGVEIDFVSVAEARRRLPSRRGRAARAMPAGLRHPLPRRGRRRGRPLKLRERPLDRRATPRQGLRLRPA